MLSYVSVSRNDNHKLKLGSGCNKLLKLGQRSAFFSFEPCSSMAHGVHGNGTHSERADEETKEGTNESATLNIKDLVWGPRQGSELSAGIPHSD